MTPFARLCLAAFLIDAAYMAGVTALPFFIFDVLHGGAALSGTIGSAQSLVYAAGCLASSLFVSRIHHILAPAVGGALFFAAVFAAAHFTRDPILFGAGIAGSVLGMCFVWPAMHSWIGGMPDPHARTRMMGRFAMWWSMGLALGPLAGGQLYLIGPWATPAVLVVCSAIAAALLASLPHERDAHGPIDEDAARDTGDARRSEQHLYAAWMANAVGWAFVAVARWVFPKRLDELVAAGELRLLFESEPAAWLTRDPAVLFSYMNFLLAGFATLAYLFLGKTRFWHHRFAVMAALQLAAAAGFFLLSFTRSLAVMAAAFLLVGAFNGAAFFSATYYATADPAQKHRRIAINEGVVGLGGFLGPLACGLIAARYGIELPLRWTPALMLLLVALQAALLAWGTRRHPNPNA